MKRLLLSVAVSLVALATVVAGNVVFAADGSGANTVNPTTANASSTGGIYSFTYTASETMDSGGITIAVPSGWSTPQATAGIAGYTTMSSTGTVGKVLDTADSITGWGHATSGSTACSGGLTLDTTTKHEGTGSVKCVNSNDKNNGVWYHNISAQNWSTANTIGFWVRTSSAINNGDLQFVYDNSSNVASPIESLSLGKSVPANTWTYVSFTMSGVRTSVISYGLKIANLSSMKDTTVWIDDILLGGGTILPTFNGSTISISAISLTAGQTITVTYGSGGGTSGATAPSSAGVNTFTTQSRISDTGTLTNITTSPTVTLSVAAPGTPDMTAGTDTGTSNTDNITSNTTPSFTVSCISGDTVTLYDNVTSIGSGTCSSSTVTITSSTLSEGVHSSINAKQNGSVASSNLSITIDTTAPTAPGTAPDMTAGSDTGSSSIDNITSTTTPTFTGSCTTGDIVNIYAGATLVGTATCSASAYSITTSALSPDGTFVMTTKFADPAGNLSTASPSLSVTIDTTADAAPGTPDMTAGTDTGSSSTDNITSNTTPSFTMSCVSGDTVTLYDNVTSVGTGTCVSSTVTITASTLSSGTHATINAKQVDTAGNSSVASSNLSITIDTTNPTSSISSPADNSTANSSTVALSGTSSDTNLASTTISVDSGSFVATGGTAASWTYSATGLTQGAHTFQTKATDSAGNTGLSSTVHVTVNLRTDPTLSVTNSPVTYSGSAQSATVTGSVAGTVTNVKYNTSATVPTSAGTYAITADFTPTDTTNYNSLTQASAGNFVINKATPTLSVTNSPVTYDGSGHAATVTGSVAGSASSILTGGSATQTNTGTYAVTANFTPTDTTNYNSLTSASAGNFVISTANQTITFGALANHTLGDADFSVSASASSGLTVAFTSQTTGVCTVSTAAVHLVSTGTCTIRASQAGNSNYNAATNVDQSFTISPANNPVPTITNISPNTKDSGGSGFTLTVNGTNFVSGAIVKWNGSSRTTTFVSNIKLTASIPASDIASSGTANITVNNPTPGGGDSNTQTLTITEPATKFVMLNPTDTVVGNNATVTVQAQDANNSVVTAYNNNVTLVASGAATGAGLVNLINGVGTIQIGDHTSETVNLTLSDTQATGLNVSSGQDVIFAAGPLFQFTVNDPGDASAGSRAAYTVTRKDQFGNLITSGVSTAYLYTSSTSGLSTFYNAATAGNTITSVTISNTASAASFWYQEGRVGAYSVTVSDNSSAPDGATGLADASDAINISPGPTSALFLNHPGGLTVGGRLGYTVTRKDSFSNLVTAGNANFFLYSSSTGVHKTFYDASIAGNVVTSVTIANGVSSANFWYFDDTAGTWTITVSDNASAPDGATGLADATDEVIVSIVPVVPTKIIILPPNNSTAGTATAVTIKAVDDAGAIDTTLNKTVTLNTSGAALGGGIVTLASGIVTVNITDQTAETVTLSLTDSGGTNLNVTSTQTVVFAPGPVTRLTLNDPGDGQAGQRFNYTVTRKDQFGNLVTSGISTVYLYTNALGNLGKFYDAPTGGNILVSATIGNGQSSADFWYEEGKAGSWTITASDNNTAPDGGSGIADANDAIAIAPGSTHDFILNDPGNISVGTRLGYTVTRKDAFGNLVALGAQDIYLYSSSSSAHKAFFGASTGGSAKTALAIPDGASSARFWYFDDAPGTFTITASDNATSSDGAAGITDATDEVTVSAIPIVATKFIIGAASPSATLGESVTITISAVDDSGNVDTSFTKDVTLRATGLATGAGLIHLVHGVGTKSISDAVAETIALSLEDTAHTGLQVEATQDVVFNAVIAPPGTAPTGSAVAAGSGAVTGGVVGGGGGGEGGTPPSFAITFSGKAAPGSLINVLGIPKGGNLALAVILDQQVSKKNGSFRVSLNDPDEKSGIYVVALTDKNNIPGQVKIFRNLPDEARLNSIIFAPTISLLRSEIRKSDFLSVSGFANPGSVIEAQFDGATLTKKITTAGEDGAYKVLLSTTDLDLGKHTVSVRSRVSGKASDFSLTRAFVLTNVFRAEVDLNGDGRLDVRDVNIFHTDFLASDPGVKGKVDFNGDGKVDLQDLSIFSQALKH